MKAVYKNVKKKSGSIHWWTDPDEFDIRCALASEVLREVDGSRLKGVRVLLDLLLHDFEKGTIEDGTVDLLLATDTVVEIQIDGEQQVAVPPARDDAQPVLRVNFRDVEERVVPDDPHSGFCFVALDRERVGELRLTTLADFIESVHQRLPLGIFFNHVFFSELCHIVLLSRYGLIPSQHHVRISYYPNIIDL